MHIAMWTLSISYLYICAALICEAFLNVVAGLTAGLVMLYI